MHFVMLYTNESQAPAINEQIFKSLVRSKHNRPVTTSRKVAKAFEKRHDNVLRDIQNLECSREFHLLNFEETQIDFKMPNGAIRKDIVYEITFDGFVMLAMGYTGKKALQFKEAYIRRFNEMAEQIKARQSKQLSKARDLVQLMEREEDFRSILRTVPTLQSEDGATFYHYLFSLEKLGFSTRSGSVWKRERRSPDEFIVEDNSTYVSEPFLYNLFLGKVKRHNDLVFRSASQQLSLNLSEGGAL